MSLRFLYDGDRVNETDTPDSLNMEDGDSIDVMVEREHNMQHFCLSDDANAWPFVQRSEGAETILHFCLVFDGPLYLVVSHSSLPIPSPNNFLGASVLILVKNDDSCPFGLRFSFNQTRIYQIIHLNDSCRGSLSSVLNCVLFRSFRPEFLSSVTKTKTEART